MFSVLRRITSLAIGGALLVLTAAPVQATGAVATTISIHIVGSTETFTTTGGALCPSGSSASSGFRFAGGGRAGTFHLDKTLTCDDGSGTFTISVNAATANGSPTDQGGWSVTGGTGAYASLSGGGNLVGTYFDGGIDDLYTGRVTP
jgi:hypothetical protein